MLPAPRPWSFAQARGRPSVAVPLQCRLRAPLALAKVASSTRFVAEPRGLATLVVADAEGDVPVLTGVAALTLDPDGVSRDPKPVPWLAADHLPRLARDAGGAWIGALSRVDGEGSGSVDVWQKGALETLGEGERFTAVDLACGEGVCALLTTRRARVAAPGAEIRIGAPGEPASAWKTIEIAPSSAGSDAYPFGLARVGAPSGDGSGGGTDSVMAALVERGECAFWAAGGGSEPREVARLRAPYGVLDALAAPDPIAMTYGSPVGDDGCFGAARGEGGEGDEDGEDPEDRDEPSAGAPGARVRFERAGLPGVDVRVPAPPLSGALRRLGRGALAVWLAPLGCGMERRVVYAVVLDPKGAPVSEVIPVGDADHFAVASLGEEVDLWVQREETVTWLRMSCAAPAP